MEAELLKARIFQVINLSIAFLAFSVALTFHFFNIGLPEIVIGGSVYGVLALTLHFAEPYIPDLQLRVSLLLTLWFGIATYLAFISGGILGPLNPIFIPIPLLALIFLPPKRAMLWTFLVLLILFCMTAYPTGAFKVSPWSEFVLTATATLTVFIIGIVQYNFSAGYRKEAEQARAQLLQTSQMTALGEISAGVAHEINNPLCVVSMKVSQLQQLSHTEKLTPQFLNETLEKINLASERIARIVSGLRTFAKDSSDEIFKQVTLKSIIDDVLVLTDQDLFEENIPEKLSIDCKKTELLQVFMNLYSNSRTAMKDLKEKWIKIDAIDQGQSVTIRFTDSGPGIRKELAEKIMQPFFTTKPLGEGTGLGLSTSFAIIKAHHGTLVLDRSAPNTCFVITLPKHQESTHA